MDRVFDHFGLGAPESLFKGHRSGCLIEQLFAKFDADKSGDLDQKECVRLVLYVASQCASLPASAEAVASRCEDHLPVKVEADHHLFGINDNVMVRRSSGGWSPAKVVAKQEGMLHVELNSEGQTLKKEIPLEPVDRLLEQVRKLCPAGGSCASQ